jgi:hypothetical protein
MQGRHVGRKGRCQPHFEVLHHLAKPALAHFDPDTGRAKR